MSNPIKLSKNTWHGRLYLWWKKDAHFKDNKKIEYREPLSFDACVPFVGADSFSFHMDSV